MGRMCGCVAVFSLVLALGVAEAPLASAQAKPRVPANVWMAVGGDPLARVLKQARRFAACVRRHGFPNLPKPRVVGNEVRLLLPPGVSRNAPRLKTARKACQKHLDPPKGGGSTDTGGNP